jgi:hypothetical protein
MENIDFYLHSIADTLVTKHKTPNFPGLYRGKMGVAVFLLHHAAHTGNPLYADDAYDLIEKSNRQFYENAPVNYPYGLSGAGAGIAYLIQSKMAEGDSDEVLEDFDRHLSEHIFDLRFLSSFNQLLDIGKYFCFRLLDTHKQEEIKKTTDKIQLLIELQLTRAPSCSPLALRMLQMLREFPKYSIFQDTPKEALDLSSIKTDFENALKRQEYGLQNGLAGVGMKCLTVLNKKQSGWQKLIMQ